MSSAGAQAVVMARSLPCWGAWRPSAWASLGLIWAISSWALRRSWNGSHRIMVVIWSPRLVGRVARWLGEDADRVADQRSLTEMNYVHSSVNSVHLSRTVFNKGDGAAAAGRIRAGRSRQLPRLPLPTRDRPRCVHPNPAGSCLDNAVAESLFATLKVELVDRQHYRSPAAHPRDGVRQAGSRRHGGL